MKAIGFSEHLDINITCEGRSKIMKFVNPVLLLQSKQLSLGEEEGGNSHRSVRCAGSHFSVFC